jgi:hypothetical protein
MPVIPAAWEAEMGGFQFRADLGKKLGRPCVNKQATHVVHSCDASCMEGRGRRIAV